MKSKMYFGLSVLCLVITVTLLIRSDGWANAASSDAGSIEDPLATKSYVDQQIEQLKKNGLTQDTSSQLDEGTTSEAVDMVELVENINKYIDNKITALQNQLNDQLSQGTQGGFSVVALNEGQQLIANEGAEIIVRSGQVTAISNASGNGLTNVTEGVDLATGDTVKMNHLIIVPRSDGRGIRSHSLSYIMVKGSYTLSE